MALNSPPLSSKQRLCDSSGVMKQQVQARASRFFAFWQQLPSDHSR